MVFANSRKAQSSRISHEIEDPAVATYSLEEMRRIDTSFQLPLRIVLVASPDLEVYFPAQQALLLIVLRDAFVEITGIRSRWDLK
jgi:hypothetical protein